MKKITRENLIKYSPLIVFGLIIISFVGNIVREGYDDSIKLNDILNCIVGCFFLPPVIYYIIHMGSKYERKTGRSFKSKSGISFDEYETIRESDKEMNPDEKRIMMRYFIISIVVMIFSMALK